MQPNYPQQGYGGPPQSFDAPEGRRANAGAAAFAGILGLLTAGALIWVVVEYFVGFEGVDTWAGEVWTIVIVRAVLALLVLVLAGLTLARKIGGAWALALFALITAATVLLEPLVVGAGIGDWFEALFKFEDTASIGIVVAAGLGLLTAIVAAIAGSTRSEA